VAASKLRNESILVPSFRDTSDHCTHSKAMYTEHARKNSFTADNTRRTRSDVLGSEIEYLPLVRLDMGILEYKNMTARTAAEQNAIRKEPTPFFEHRFRFRGYESTLVFPLSRRIS
jgi:hypothetical protein